MNTRISDCIVLNLNQIGDRKGKITFVNNSIDIPFDIKRIFYLFDIPGGESRGAHAHRKCGQILIAASGSFEVELDDSSSKKTITLNKPSLGLYIPPGIWASEINFSSGSICLVLASELFIEKDYIRDYFKFLKYKKNDSSTIRY